ncbi:Hypp8321 [Branchiostoma lanceolatum]|uniref:Hypp8321 protein n=1 Tax=Branchiostoma lanceolatum TaxID=7740 RepID=A0A8J9Z6N0_BRALA|nr:Hypp8321 [Branchiostoma lanceolatum]
MQSAPGLQQRTAFQMQSALGLQQGTAFQMQSAPGLQQGTALQMQSAPGIQQRTAFQIQSAPGLQQGTALQKTAQKTTWWIPPLCPGQLLRVAFHCLEVPLKTKRYWEARKRRGGDPGAGQNVADHIQQQLEAPDGHPFARHVIRGYDKEQDSWEGNDGTDRETADTQKTGINREMEVNRRRRMVEMEEVKIQMMKRVTEVKERSVITRSLALLTLELIITLCIDLQVAVNWVDLVNATLSTDPQPDTEMQSLDASPDAAPDEEMPSV